MKNICKFINQKESGSLFVNNFIFESKVPHSGESLNHSYNLLYLVNSGEGYFKSGNITRKISSGMILFSFADIPVIIENTNNLTYYYISFYGSRSDELIRRFGITPKNSVFEGYESLLPFWNDAILRADEDNIDLLSEGVLLYTFSKLKKGDNKYKDLISFVLNYMEDHFTEHDLTLSKVSNEAGYNSKYLSHYFKTEFGMTFSEYLRLLRIKHAVMLIENGVTSVKNVAILSGFSDPLYFSKVFTEEIGISPSSFIKQDRIKTAEL